MSRDGKNPRQHGPESLQFITVTEANYKDGKPQQHPNVRRHVMLGRRRRERLAATQQYLQRRMQEPTSRSSEGTASAAQAADLATDGATRQKKQRDVREGQSHSVSEGQLALARQHPAAWRLDPFGSFAAPLDRHVQAGLEYCEYAALLDRITISYLICSGSHPFRILGPSHFVLANMVFHGLSTSAALWSITHYTVLQPMPNVHMLRKKDAHRVEKRFDKRVTNIERAVRITG